MENITETQSTATTTTSTNLQKVNKRLEVAVIVLAASTLFFLTATVTAVLALGDTTRDLVTMSVQTGQTSPVLDKLRAETNLDK